ncbi:hypothetical protein LNP00_04375 [Fructobacillus sp. M158]|uniref:competence protein CoiA n=1 Tax=Fructobacillus parabroussonetiae TaxID=2713174 RepID=UPI00200A455C|nr:competence protein CoiA family protein [Fructobacillus parabroussonetiae]MCK8617598.1 hypothetical protein [Fructobacillus parabroussonetiae]
MLIAVTIRNDYCFAEKAKKNEIYLCPGCRGPVRLKQGEEKIAHFAHVAKKDCTGFSEGETPEHLAGKLALYRYFKGKLPVLVEPVLSGIAQRPDLLVGRPGNQVAIEYQCSPISKGDLLSRIAGYAKAGIRVWWLLGPNYYRKHLSVATICRFWISGRLWYYLAQDKGFVEESHFARVDFKKRLSDKRVLKDPLSLNKGGLAAWHRVFQREEKKDHLAVRPLDDERQRSKLALQLAREQIDARLVGYLYERGQRVDQLPFIFLRGRAFGLKIANWQFRLRFIY